MKKPPVPVLALMALCVLVFGFLILRNLGARSARVAAAGTVTITPSPTQTLIRSPTPTPLALEVQDAIIRNSDTTSSSSAAIFPVNLRVILGSEAQPRIFVVQRRLIQPTEWNYDDNPDTAS